MKTLELGQLQSLSASWLMHLEAGQKSPKTLKSYKAAADQLQSFLDAAGMPTAVAAIHREHLEAFMVALLERTSASTAATRYRGLQQLFKWLVEEGEIDRNPMERMKPPKVGERPVPVIEDEDLRALFAACKGQEFEQRRDTAILRVMLSTGGRLAEIANLKLEDVDLAQRGLSVVGKGDKVRVLSLTSKAVKDLDRYLRARARHRDADMPWLWLGVRGRVTDSGIYQIIERRAQRAGIGHIHPHQFRHTFSHKWLTAGGNEHDLAKLNGWTTTQMVGRYASSSATERARAAHSRIAPGDEF